MMIYTSTIVAKPWGREIIWADCEHYLGKIIEVDAGKRLSLQYHERKTETMRVLSGSMKIEIQTIGQGALDAFILKPGDGVHVDPMTTHRVRAITDLRILEVSTPHKGDIMRLDDDFGRQSDVKAN